MLGRKARAVAKSRKWSHLLGLWYRRWVIGSKVKEAVWEKVGQGFEKGDQMSGLILWAAGSCSVFWAFKRSDQKKLWCLTHVAKMKLKDERLEVINQIRRYFCVGFSFWFLFVRLFLAIVLECSRDLDQHGGGENRETSQRTTKVWHLHVLANGLDLGDGECTVSYWFCNKLPQTWWLETTLAVISLTLVSLGCHQGICRAVFRLEALEDNLFVYLL